MSDKKEPFFHIEYKYEDDITKENKTIGKLVSEDEKSVFCFKGEYFYYLGRGHDFLNGFFSTYVTRSGLKAHQFYSGRWNIGNDDYDYIDGVFVLIPPTPPSEPIDWGSFEFPIVKNIESGLISDKIIPVKPKYHK